MTEATPKSAAAEIAGRVRALDRDGLVALVGLLVGDVAALRDEARSREEMKRRAGILAGRAAEGSYGRAKCVLCGKEKHSYEMARHILRAHGDQVAEMPAGEFRLPGGRGPRAAG
jgi:hypothetical protein